MSTFDEYANRYKTIRMERRDGILLMQLHTNGKELQWGALPHGELPHAFQDIADDKENRVVILTGTGSEFSVLPAQNANGNWVKVAQRVPVRIAFDSKPPREMIAGLSSTVTVHVDGKK